MPRPPAYGIIYNWDGAPHGYSEVPQSLDAFLEKTYAPLTGTQVGALFWCIGEHATRWPTEELEVLGDVHGRRYENAHSYTHTENIRRMLDRGEDPQQAVIDRGRELEIEVFASVRMNDNHFNGAQLTDLLNLHHTELTQLRIDHPDWLLGDRNSEWFALSWDMSVPEVRENRLTHVREVCTRYDWDGVELDWQRHAFHLPEDQAYRLRYTLTDLQRSIRTMTNEIARKRGRPFHVAVRVSGSLERCRQIGYDLPVWIEDDLFDILIPAANAATDPAIDVASYLELCEGTSIVVYPGFDSGLPGAHVGPEEPDEKNRMRVRAIASRYHDAGANGIYVFNWHADAHTRHELLTQIGSPESLQDTDKIYAGTHRIIVKDGDWRGAYRGDRLRGELPVPLKPTMSGEGPSVILNVVDGKAASCELRIRLEQWVQGDRVAVSWDGSPLGDPRTSYCRVRDPHRISDVSHAVWLQFDIHPCVPGPHEVKVALIERHPQLACDLVLTDVELVVRHD
tara:strand:+ start:3355 stop:4884 length:1530 start_codon:yes stop_codon:yes gene_type:complete